MEAASRPLELLPDLPVEEAPGAAHGSAAVSKPAAASLATSPSAPPARDPSQTGITLLDPEALLLEGAEAESAAVAPVAPAPSPAADSEFVLEDPAVVDELLTAPPPAPAKAVAATPTPAAAAAAAAPPAAEPARETRVPLIRTASLSSAATKVAATKLAAASRRTTDVGAPKPAVPTIPVAQPAPAPAPAAAKPAAQPAPTPAPAAAKPAAPKAAGNSNEGLAGWTNARATATVPSKPKSAPALPAGAAVPPPAPKAHAAPKAAPAAAAAAPAASAAAGVSPPAAPMDRDYIARNQVVERYLSGRLPLKGATEFEQFVGKHPELLDEIGLPERVNAGLRLLEASGKPEPWQEAPRPAWQKPPVTLALAAATAVLAVLAMVLTGTSASKNHKIAELQKQVIEQPLDPATSTREIRLMPNRSGASNAPAITIGGGGAQLADFKLDESRSPYHIFRVTIDRIDQGRVGVITNLVKDSNGHLRIALNSSALGPGNYQLTIEGLNWRGDPEADSWVTIGIAR
jgi:hypothetical protein